MYLNISNKGQDCKIGTVWGVKCGRVKDEADAIRLMDFIYLREIEQKPLAIALSGWGQEGDGGDDLTNVQCKPIWNCHNEFPLYNEYILIKIVLKR
jgi:hypothetical protein